jgi:hypothetical protein
VGCGCGDHGPLLSMELYCTVSVLYPYYCTVQSPIDTVLITRTGTYKSIAKGSNPPPPPTPADQRPATSLNDED